MAMVFKERLNRPPGLLHLSFHSTRPEGRARPGRTWPPQRL